MKIGIIGLPQAGKTTLFKILTKASAPAGGGREAHVGVAKVPDARLDKLAALFKPKKLTYASVEFADTPAATGEALNSAALRQADALAHVARAFGESPNPSGDIRNLEMEFMINDLGQIEKRLARLEKEGRKSKEAGIQMEFNLLKRSKAHLEAEKPLREMEMSPEDRKRIRGFTFLSEKPILYVLNLAESEAGQLEDAPARCNLSQIADRLNTAATAVCGKMEAELAEMSDAEAAEFLAGYGLKESGLVRFVRKAYELAGVISFFTAGEDECRAWTVPRGSLAVGAAGAIHSDLAKRFIRAETIRWDELLEAGSEAAARAKGKLRLEGKDYVVQDGDVLHVRHGG